ncbi:PucR family transcriptional regulator [Nonomuraea sp. NPDC049480]|uniref:PucR family transcriptional regulator n=1 Tax=Nonomuraea sp. NPDC049480 TaxID=3364353 RepID=UPI00378EBAB0
MGHSTIQDIVDDLAERLQRSVAVDDAGIRLLYTSPHYGDEDEVRIRAVLQRDAGGKAIGHVLAQGVTNWTTAGIIPPKPEIGFKARVCVPIRRRSELLGLLIVLDADGTLTTSELATISATARELASLMIDVHGPTVDAASLTRESAVDGLLDADAGVRREALRALADSGGTRLGEHVRAVAVEVRDDDEPATPSHITIALRRALSAQTRANPGGKILFCVHDRRAALVLCSHSPVPAPDVDRFTDQLIRQVHDVSDGRFTCVAGIGSAMTGLAAAWSSYRQAQLACRAAGAMVPAPVAHWSGLGTLGILLRLPPGEIRLETLPDEMQRLLAVDRDRRLTATLRAYLDTGGSGPAASAALHIHRTTLYYRLERIVELTGLDLADGRTRLTLHLGLQLLDLIENDFRQ